MENCDFSDDDFGELYADLHVLPTPPPPPPPPPQQQDDGNLNNADDDYIATDSDDDLNIVLNDDDCCGDEKFVNLHCGSLGNNENEDYVDHSKIGSEQLVSSADGQCVQSKNAVKGGYGSQFFRSKFMKTQGSMFVNNMKTQGRGDNIQNQISSSIYFDGSFLPWHWNIYDVNIDKLENKPWRIPEADITDYFNFGFNENTWKQYCLSLASTQERFDQAAFGSVHSHSSKCKVPKGRAIQVEESVVERQPSIHARHPRSIDSDVIIQIKVHGSSDNHSGSVKSNIHDISKESGLVSDNNSTKSKSSSEHDVLSEEQLVDAKVSEESSGQERNDLIPDVVKVQHPEEEGQNSGDVDMQGEKTKTEERIDIDTSNSDPCWSEPELSLGDQELSLTSYSDNDSEGTQDSIHVDIDNERNHSPLRSHLVNSVTGLNESSSLHDKNSKNISVNRKPVNISYYSRNRGSVHQDWRHQNGRYMPGSKLKKHLESDNNVSHILKSDGRVLSPRGRQFVNYKLEERLQYFGSHERKDVSYTRETRQSCYYGPDKIVDDQDQAVYAEYSDWEDGDRFREDANQYIRKSWDNRECCFEQRTLMKYNEDNDWHPVSRKHYGDDNLSYRESNQFLPKHSSFPTKDRETQRRLLHHKPYFKDRNCDHDQQFDEYHFLNKSYRMPSSFAERKMESLNNTDEDQFLQIDRELERYTARGRHHDRPPLVVDTLWSEKLEDEFPNYKHNTNSYLKHQRQSCNDSARNYMHRVNEDFRGHERQKHATSGGNDWHWAYADSGEVEDFATSPVDECELYALPYEVPHYTNDDNTVWHHDGLHPEEALYYEETIRHERQSRNGSLHARVQRNDLKLQHNQLNLSRRDRDHFLKRNSKVMCRDHCHQTVLRCRKSVDLINRKGKSDKSSRVNSNDRLQNVDRGMAEKRKALVGFDDSHKKTIKLDISKSQCDNKYKKSFQNIPDKAQKEGMDVEDGEIVTEEPSAKVSVSRRDVSEGSALADSVKEGMSQNGNNSELHSGDFDNQKILGILAKMEKRRERFKQPISVIKEADKSTKLITDSAVDLSEIKQQKPTRKRRWNVG